MGELLRPDHLRERLAQIVPFKNRLMVAFANGHGGNKTFDPKAERFVGDNGANELLTRRYRQPFVVPAKA